MGGYFWIGELPTSQPILQKQQPICPATEAHPNAPELLPNFQCLMEYMTHHCTIKKKVIAIYKT